MDSNVIGSWLAISILDAVLHQLFYESSKIICATNTNVNLGAGIGEARDVEKKYSPDTNQNEN